MNYIDEIPIVKIGDMIPIQYGNHVVKELDSFPCVTARYYKGILNNQEEAAVGVLIGVPKDDILPFGIDKSEGGYKRE